MRICVFKFKSKFIHFSFAFLRRTNNQSLTIMHIFQSIAFMISRAGVSFRTIIQIDTGFKLVDIDGVINNVGAFDIKNTRA